ncbi:MAG: AAA family ATPase, partial [Verrucomicrobiota bacterium]
LYRYEGSVNKLNVDDKGVTLVAALGLPPLAHEDDALRGVLAGLSMHDELTRLGWRSSVGVTSGGVFCGTIGSEKRCEYTIMGDVVNLSARLMQAAAGGVLCDEPTFKAAQTRLIWEILAPIKVKGKDRPIPIFRPLGPALSASAAQTTRSMVGRASERAILEGRLDRLARERRSGVVIIEGEAGIGKSRLVRHLAERARHHGVAMLVGVADAVERSTPYYAWRSVFRSLFQLDEGDKNLETARDRVGRELAFDPELAALAPLLNVVLSVDLPETPATAAMFGELRVNNTREMLVTLLRRRTASRPLLLILEDCHWLDSTSWAVAFQMAENVESLLLILVTRQLAEPVPREYGQFLANPGTQRLTLTPLSQEECLDLVCHRLGVGSLPPPVVGLLRARAQGNPFFIEELIYALREAEKIQVADGQCTVSAGVDLDTLPFPDTVQGLVTSRIDRLSPQEQLVLKVASVIGRTFASDILFDVCPIEEDKPNLDAYLATFTRQNLTLLDAPDPDPVYLFKHVITQEVAYQMMGAGQRRLLHQAVAEWYEGNHQSDLSPFFPLLAKHWSHTDQFTKAQEYLEKAGMSAMRDFANEEAVGFFSQALVIDAQSGNLSPVFRRACWQGQLGTAYFNLGKMDLGLRHFQLALELLGYPFPRTGWGMLLATFREMGRQVVHQLWPGRVLGRAGSREAWYREAAHAYERVTEIHYLQNARVPSIHGAFRALNLSELLGESPELARSHGNAGILYGLLMMHGTARRHCKRARAMAAALGQLPTMAYAEFVRGVYWSTIGLWEDAGHDLTKAMAIMKQIGERHHLGESAFVHSVALSRQGHFKQSAAFAFELHSADRYRNDTQLRVWGLSWQIWCLLACDPASADLAVLEAALKTCMEPRPEISVTDGDRILGFSLLALAQWRRGEFAAARLAAEAVERLMAGTHITQYLLEAYVALAEVYLGLWTRYPEEAAEIRRRTENIGGILNQFALMYPVARPRKWLVRGQYHWIKGQPRRATRAWKKAVAAAERFRMPYELAIAHAFLGRHGRMEEPARAGHLGRAAELFVQVGAERGLAPWP